MKLVLLVVTVAAVTGVRSSNFTSADDTCDVDGPGPWSALLEEWAISAGERPGRQGRIMALPPSSGYYITDRIDTPLVPPPAPRPAGSRPYEEWAATPPPPPGPGKIVNRPPNPYKDKFKPSYEYTPPQQNKPIPAYPQQPNRPNSIDRLDDPPRKQVTETDLYLLSAIEKLVYRADLMEKRLRKLEESMHVLVAGSNHHPDPCVANFTRVGDTCYHFSAAGADWKTANLACRKLRSNLLELEAEPERRQLLAHLLSDHKIKALDWWTGGLNPGLLWIWSNSARPVSGGTGAAGAAGAAGNVTVVGDGRCLALVHDPAARSYVYRGQDCGLKHRYVCEKGEDKAKLSNEIETVSKNKLTNEITTETPNKPSTQS
ncbi:uncharacterized protein LOC125241148 [Leguminivora glycinivorella]|uniref:uncharacterized protein LOC125241148 n=1 Tax=Leguminivora glycinivorella TaxID=1035111 RepID=UPI00200CD1F5|nr:uncharacterized protein LOC125241148 [Leguminivora glycinivorella]